MIKVVLTRLVTTCLVSSRVGYNENLPLNSETIYRNPETLARSNILFLIEIRKLISNNTHKITYKKMALTYSSSHLSINNASYLKQAVPTYCFLPSFSSYEKLQVPQSRSQALLRASLQTMLIRLF